MTDPLSPPTGGDLPQKGREYLEPITNLNYRQRFFPPPGEIKGGVKVVNTIIH